MPRRSLLLALGLVSLAGSLWSQSERRFEPVTEEGIGPHRTRALAQSADGTLWVGTQEGLFWFDGQDHGWLRRSTTEGLRSNRISSLVVDDLGALWIGTRGGGLSRRDPTTTAFTNYSHEPDDPRSLGEDDIMALALDWEGRLWIATARNGLSRLDLDSVEAGFERIEHDPERTESLSDSRTRTLHIDPSGTLWVGTMGGVNRLRPGTENQFDHFRHDPDRANSLPDDEVWSLWLDRDDNLWVGMWGGGLSRLRQASRAEPHAAFETYTPPPGQEPRPWGLQDNRVMALFGDHLGSLWIGTQSGLHELPESERNATSPRLLRHDRALTATDRLHHVEVNAFLADLNGDLWVGSESGTMRLDRRFEAIEVLRYEEDTPTSVLSGVPHATALDSRGRLWVVSDATLDRLERTHSPYQTPERATIPIANASHPEHTIDAHSLLFTDNGDLWILTFEGLFRLPQDQLDASAPVLEHYLEGLSSDAVLSAFEDSTGQLWVGTYRGLHRAERGANGEILAFEDFLHDPGDAATLSSTSASELAEGPPGTLWIGSYRGLSRLDLETKAIQRIYAGPGSLDNDFIDSLWFQAPRHLWIGTRGGGLHRLDTADGTLDHYDTSTGLPSDVVHGLIPAPDDTLWVATPPSVFRFDPTSGQVLHQLDVSQGLEDSEHLFIDRAGDQLAVLGHFEVTLLPLEGFPAPTEPPRVHLQELLVGNERVTVDPEGLLPLPLAQLPELTLSYRDLLVALQFGTVEFRRPREIEYRYRLVGLDDHWYTTDASDRKATYTQLPPGRYRFEAQARYPGARWDSAVATLAVHVTPPWWGTWWARTVAALCLVSLAVLWPLRRYRQAQRRATELEQRVAERTQELQLANQRLEEMVRFDYLTGIPNRRHFIERAQEALTSQRRTQRPLCLALADLDDFKRINDVHGHDTGDSVLVTTADLMTQTARESDLVARWGGEEFILLFYDCPLEGARQAAEAIRSAIETYDFGLPTPVSMTFGVTEVAPDQDLETATALADEALYAGKRAGKNCIQAAQWPAV